MDFQQTLKRISKNCEITYQRIVELRPENKESKDEMSHSTAVSRHKVHGPRREDVTEDQLKLCFHRITLTEDLRSLMNRTQWVSRCHLCSAEFRGPYGRGNLGRHWRQKHAGPAKSWTCENEHCNKVFLRADARLKHYRHRHPGLALRP